MGSVLACNQNIINWQLNSPSQAGSFYLPERIDMETQEQEPQQLKRPVVELAKHIAYVVTGPHPLASHGDHYFSVNHQETTEIQAETSNLA